MGHEEYLQQYLGFKDELKTYLFRLLTDRHECEDVLQETYIKLSQNIEGFRGEASFKTWVYSIATNLAKNQLAKQSRWELDYQDRGRDLHIQSEEMAKEVHRLE